jgi:outer membrane biosynthesis protein TonB
LVQPTGPTGPTAPTEQTTPAPPFSEPLGTKPAEPAPPPTPPPTPPPEPTPPSPIVVAPPPVVPPPARHHWYQDKIGDAMVGIGGLAIIGGIIEYSSATSDLDSAEKASTISGYDSKLDEAHSARTMSLAFGIGGVVLVGGGIIHYMVTGHSAEQPAVSAAPTRGGALITWSGGF